MATSFSFKDRTHNLKQMPQQTFDVVVIGGGITGAGVARDAISRGMSVALVEASDFASGTSSRSSKLIHGGIRYLENLEFGLVFEALSERRTLFEIAPHLVHPLRFVLPLYKGGRVGMFKMGLGMWLYDALSMFEAPEMHQRLDSQESTDRLPLLRSKDLLGSFTYYDAYMDDDRLVHETLRSAAKQGALCVNYVRAMDAELIEGRMTALTCRDELTGSEFKIQGRHFVSTVGPWTDRVAHRLLGEWKKVMRPSKGIHLTVHRDRLPLTDAVVMAADKENRIVFGIPRHEMIIIGTTDTDFSGDPQDVKSTREDVDYLLDIVDEYFPGAKITEDDILASYSGVRPLVDDGSESESKTSREHFILNDERNITFVTGGKYTTYRHMAEETVDSFLVSFPLEDQVRFGRNNTKTPLNDKVTRETMQRAYDEADLWAEHFSVSLSDVRLLIDRHGFEAFDVLARRGQLSDFKGDSLLWGLELLHALENTMCFELRDFYLRRSPLFLSRKDHGLSLIQDLSGIMAAKLGWSDAERNKQIDALHEHIRHELGWMKG